MVEERLVRLEEKLAYLEATVAELHEALLRQQERIGQGEAALQRLGERLQAHFEGEAGDPLDERPPHY
ncbi:MAG TPA: SlyX family protein [Gammaproteobacteria bacterium]